MTTIRKAMRRVLRLSNVAFSLNREISRARGATRRVNIVTPRPHNNTVRLHNDQSARHRFARETFRRHVQGGTVHLALSLSLLVTFSVIFTGGVTDDLSSQIEGSGGECLATVCQTPDTVPSDGISTTLMRSANRVIQQRRTV